LPGVVGLIQATEAIKAVLGRGDLLKGRLLTYDALDQSFRTLKVNRDPACPACSDGTEIVIADYDDLCLPHATLKDGSTTGH
jgi:adenylyltransferase/sulfurtransferase